MEDDEAQYKAHPVTRGLKYMAMMGTAALVFASGMASGMFVDGTSETILAYRTQAVATPRHQTVTRAMAISYEQPARSAVAPAMARPAIGTAWFPEHNSVRWDVSLAPGQDMSGLSIRNAHSDRNLVVILNAVGQSGEWIRAGIVNVAAGREAVVHPPTGSYAMTVVAMPLDMPYDDMERAATSQTAYFDLMDAEGADTVPVTRFQVTNGEPQRLPDLTTYASSRADRDADA